MRGQDRTRALVEHSPVTRRLLRSSARPRPKKRAGPIAWGELVACRRTTMTRSKRTPCLGAVVVPVALGTEVHDLFAISVAGAHHEFLARTCTRYRAVAGQFARHRVPTLPRDLTSASSCGIVGPWRKRSTARSARSPVVVARASVASRARPSAASSFCPSAGSESADRRAHDGVRGKPVLRTLRGRGRSAATRDAACSLPVDTTFHEADENNLYR